MVRRWPLYHCECGLDGQAICYFAHLVIPTRGLVSIFATRFYVYSYLFWGDYGRCRTLSRVGSWQMAAAYSGEEKSLEDVEV